MAQRAVTQSQEHSNFNLNTYQGTVTLSGDAGGLLTFADLLNAAAKKGLVVAGGADGSIQLKTAATPNQEVLVLRLGPLTIISGPQEEFQILETELRKVAESGQKRSYKKFAIQLKV